MNVKRVILSLLGILALVFGLMPNYPAYSMPALSAIDASQFRVPVAD